MKIEKEKHKVSISCANGATVVGFVHLISGERMSDFINHSKEQFISVTNAEISGTGPVIKCDSIVLNRKSIIWLREI